MASNKLYRSFIILQEDERGHSVSADKPLSGYAKIEAKGEKCKIAFYAQNLKTDEEKCHIALVCDKKDGNYILDLGLMNINAQGKAETSLEYSINNIGNLDVSYDKIVGAVIYKEFAGKAVFLMCGFLNGAQPKDDWKGYNILSKGGLNSRSQKAKENKKEVKEEHKKHNKGEELKEIKEVEAEKEEKRNNTKDDTKLEDDIDTLDEVDKEEDIKVEEEPRGEEETIEEDNNLEEANSVIEENIVDVISENNEDRFEESENIIEARISGGNYEREADESYSVSEAERVVERIELQTLIQPTGSTQQGQMQPTGGMQQGQMQPTGSMQQWQMQPTGSTQQWKMQPTGSMQQGQMQPTGTMQQGKVQGIVGTATSQSQMDDGKIGTMHAGYKAWQGRYLENDNRDNDKDDDEQFKLTGSTAEFFSSVANGFEYIKDFAKDIKRCKWYKVKVESFDVLCNMSNYNKYTVAYYPMINYYPYISKKGYYMIGFKYDENGIVKYITYAIPGYKDKIEQPYGGKTGFVTWCPEFTNANDGHWIMFYDFQNYKVLIPIK